jgi:hypothetical protein
MQLRQDDGRGGRFVTVTLSEDEAREIVSGRPERLREALRDLLAADRADPTPVGFQDPGAASDALAGLFEARSDLPPRRGSTSVLPSVPSLIARLEEHLGEDLLRWAGSKERALYEGQTVRVAVTRSKFHEGKGIYWFGYHLGWQSFLRQASGQGYVAMACADSRLLCVPAGVLDGAVERLSFKDAAGGKGWWHIEVEPRGEHLIVRHAGLDLTAYDIET